MKNYLILLFIVFNSIGNCQSQTIVATKINQITIEADIFLGFDAFGGVYYLKNDVFSLYKDSISLEYKNVSMGKITHIDIQNPLKLVLFYENFNSIVLLDNQLNELQRINLTEINSPIVASAVGLASQNRLWIYNNLNQELGFFDFLKNSFQTVSPPLTGVIQFYSTDFNAFQWIDENSNWYSCDVFGKITFLGTIPDFDHIQLISNQTVIFSKSGLVNYFDVEKNKIYPIENIKKSSTNFYYKDQILSIFTNGEINNYKITIP